MQRDSKRALPDIGHPFHAGEKFRSYVNTFFHGASAKKKTGDVDIP